MRLARIENQDEQLQVTLDRAIREFSILAVNREIPIERPLQLSDLAIPITSDLINRLAIVALSTVVYHARRGNLKAAQMLLDRALGAVEQPFSVKVQTMTLDDCRGQLVQELERSGIRGPIAAQLTEKLLNGDETPPF